MDFDLSPPSFLFYGEGSNLLVKLHPDGRVEIPDRTSLDEATRTFWDAVEQCGFERIVPAGFALVPIEATDDMHAAGFAAMQDVSFSSRAYDHTKAAWDAMVAARPVSGST